MATIILELPDDQLEGLGDDIHTAAQTIRLAAAFHLCSRGGISTSRAARLAGLSYAGFLEAAVTHGVDLYRYDNAEIKEELDRPLPEGADLEAIKRELDRAQSARG
jgi:predicted HTH domain antitoxin